MERMGKKECAFGVHKERKSELEYELNVAVNYASQGVS